MAKLYVFVTNPNHTDDHDDDVLIISNEPPVYADGQLVLANENVLHLAYDFGSYLKFGEPEPNTLSRMLVMMNICQTTVSPAVYTGKEYLIINFSPAGTVPAVKAKRNKCPCCGK